MKQRVTIGAVAERANAEAGENLVLIG